MKKEQIEKKLSEKVGVAWRFIPWYIREEIVEYCGKLYNDGYCHGFEDGEFETFEDMKHESSKAYKEGFADGADY